MKESPLVSVVVPNYNGERFLRECLCSLSAQTYGNIEVILVDNGSKDESLKIARESKTEPRIIRLEENTGFSHAVNTGIRESKGDLVFLLNNDTSCHSRCIESLVALIETDRRIFSVNCRMIQYNKRELLDDTGDGYCLLGLSYKRGYNQGTKRKNKKRRIFSSCAGASLYRKITLDETGLFDENFFAYLEDVDLGYRANVLGYRNMYCPEAVVYHIMSGTMGIEKSEFKTMLSARNNTYLIYKNMPWIQLLLNLPFLLAGVIIKSIFFARHGLAWTYFKSSFAAVKNLGKLKKTKFRTRNLPNYIYIQAMLILNCFDMAIERMIR